MVINMPEYKKKKVRKTVHNKRAKNVNNDIKMKPSRVKKSIGVLPEKEMRVVKGNKLERNRKLRILGLTAVLLVAVLLLVSYIMPVSLSENISNWVALTGNGSYPIEISGAQTLNAISKGSYYYVLTDTNLSAFSNSGKQILSVAHGFSNPVLKTSQTRALIFEQGGNTLYVYNLKRLVKSIETKSSIITASISRSGAFAVATGSNEYTATVTVYNKRGNQIYQWNSAKNIVNNVCVSPSGKKIAVSTLNASGGQYVSGVEVLTFDSADAKANFEFSGEIIYSLENTRNGFLALTKSGSSYVSWSKYSKQDIKNERMLDMYRTDGNRSLLVFNRTSDRSDNLIMLLSSKGDKISEFQFNGIISDIEVSRGHIYCISDTKIYLFDKNGNVVRTGECGYGCKKIAAIGSNSVAVISDSSIEKVQIEGVNK